MTAFIVAIVALTVGWWLGARFKEEGLLLKARIGEALRAQAIDDMADHSSTEWSD